jgi:hypothetical protein
VWLPRDFQYLLVGHDEKVAVECLRAPSIELYRTCRASPPRPRPPRRRSEPHRSAAPSRARATAAAGARRRRGASVREAATGSAARIDRASGVALAPPPTESIWLTMADAGALRATEIGNVGIQTPAAPSRWREVRVIVVVHHLVPCYLACSDRHA